MAARKTASTTVEGSRANLRVLYLDEAHAVGALGEVLIMLSRAEPSLEFLQRTVRLIQDTAREHPEGLGLFVVISADAKPPSDAARQYFARSVTEYGQKVRAMARIVEGIGFLAAAKRSAIAMIQLVSRLPFPAKVFGTQTEAAVWLTQEITKTTQVRRSVTELIGASLELRSIHDRRMPMPMPTPDGGTS
jgi:hypothetical protein